jgi:hypothetical protein
MMITGTLKAWRREVFEDEDGKEGYYYVGRVYGDVKNRFFDGQYIHTSAVNVGPVDGGLIFTENSVYQLDLGEEAVVNHLPSFVPDEAPEVEEEYVNDYDYYDYDDEYYLSGDAYEDERLAENELDEEFNTQYERSNS